MGRLSNARRLALLLGAVLLLLVGLDLFVEHHAAFGIDGTPGFAAWYGIAAGAAAIGLAFGWSRAARRPETRAEQEGRDG